MIAGDTNKFALECVVSKEDCGEGKIFIIVGDNKYGNRCGDFCLNSFFDSIKYQLSVFNPIVPALYDFGHIELFESLDAVWDDTSVDKCPIDNVINGFFDDPSDVLDEIVFYGGNYAFDGVAVILISNGEKTKLMLRDHKDMRVSEITIGADEFKNRFFELEKSYRDSVKNR